MVVGVAYGEDITVYGRYIIVLATDESILCFV